MQFSLKLALILVVLWVGGLWMTGISATILFAKLHDRSLAGNIAGYLFTAISYIGIGSALYLLGQRLNQYGAAAISQTYFWAVIVMLLLTLAGQFGIQPILAQLKTAALPHDVMHSVFASRFSAWHGVASIAYLGECLLGFVLVHKLR